MKLRTSQKVHYDTGPNMTPLVDIVMVILIFLMLTGTFAVGEHFLRSNQAITGKGSAEALPNVPLDEPLTITVDSLSENEWSATFGGYRVNNSRVAMEKQLTQMHEAMNEAGTPTDRIKVVISPGQRTKYKHLVEVFEAALNAKLTKVGFSTAH
jgi:biopolymer transport protein ExbD